MTSKAPAPVPGAAVICAAGFDAVTVAGTTVAVDTTSDAEVGL